MKKAILILAVVFFAISAINVHAAPKVSILSGPTNDLVTNQPFSVTLSVDEDFGYWSTNGSAFQQFAAGTTPIILIGKTTTLKYYGQDVLNNTSSTQTKNYTINIPRLVLWNKLGSTTEINNSEVGPSATITGTPVFMSAKYGNGLYRANINDRIGFEMLSFVPNCFTAELWLKTDYAVNNGNPADGIAHAIWTWKNGGDVMIFVFQPGSYKTYLIVQQNGSIFTEYEFDAGSWTANVLQHIAVVYNHNGICGTGDIARLYVNGMMVGQSSLSPPPAYSQGGMWLPGIIAGGSTGYGTIFECPFNGTIDNLKIWNYAKTNFSDRCSEDGLTSCPPNEPPIVTLSQPDGVSDAADLSYTIKYTLSDPDDNATVSLYYSTNNSGFNGTLIAAGLPESADGSYIWNTAAISNGSYYVYAVAEDGVNSAVKVYSSGRLTINHPRLVFWNKLGSGSESSNSMVGSGLAPVGRTHLYGIGKFGNGFYLPSWQSSPNNQGLRSLDVFSSAVINDFAKLTIEFWYKPDFNIVNGIADNGKYNGSVGIYDCADVRIQGGYSYYNKSLGLVFSGNAGDKTYLQWFYDNIGNGGYVTFDNVNMVAGTLYHVAAVLDRNNPEPSKKYRLFVDNASKLSSGVHSTEFPEIGMQSENLKYAVGDYCYVADIHGNAPLDFAGRAIIDNIKVYNYIKTNFSDRCSEDGSVSCPNMPPVVAISQPDGVSDAADSSYTIKYTLSDPDDNATVSLYYSTNNSGYDGTLITSGLAESADGSYIWNTAAISNGSYYVYAVAADGVNSAVKVYSSGKLVIRHGVPGAVYVSALNGNDDTGDGSRTAPFRTIQKGIQAARINNFKNVCIAEGIYQENVVLQNNVSLLGGYSSDFLNRDKLRNQYISIIDAGHRGSGIYGVGLTNVLRIEGFIIKNGSGMVGGGINVGSISNVIVNNNEIRDCAVSYYGGGISGSGETYSNIFVNDSSRWFGGGVSSCGKLFDNKFVNCSSLYIGGGIYFTGGIIISNNIIENCFVDSVYGFGGGIGGAGSFAKICNNNIEKCSGASGGALYLIGSSMTVCSNVINNNFSGIYIGQGDATMIYNNIMTSNLSSKTVVRAGGDCTVSVSDSSHIVFFNNILNKNRSLYTLKVDSDSAVIVHNSLISNAGCDIFLNNQSKTTIVNNILNDIIINNSFSGFSVLSNNCFWGTNPNYVFDQTSSTSYTNEMQINSFLNGISGGNIIADPQLLADGITPSLTSRCINNGLDPRFYIPALTNDYFGNPRPSPAGGRFDIGAVEVPNANAVPYVNIIQPATNVSVDSSCTIKYELADPDNNATVSLYYDIDNSGFDGTLITANLSETTNGSYVWDTTAVPEGSYYVYAVAEDGVNPAEKAYSSGRVSVNHSGLVLWNKLGSGSEVSNSIVGPNGRITGSPGFGPAKFGSGLHCSNNSDYVSFDLPVLNSFAMEFWFESDWASINGINSDGAFSHCWFTWIRDNYEKIGMETYSDLYGPVNTKTWFFSVTHSQNSTGEILPNLENFTWNSNDLHHFAVVLDINGIGGTADKARFYLDGRLISSSTLPYPAHNPADLYSLILMQFNDYQRSFRGTMDNLKIWNYAKTNFSDRCSEDGSTTCPETPLIKLVYPADQLSLSDTTPTFKWEVPQSLDSKNLHFILEVSENSSFTSSLVFDSSLLAAGFNPSPPVRPGVGAQYFTLLKALKKSVTYYWRVKAWSEPDNIIYSDQRVFIIH